MASTFLSFPEELIERILSLALSAHDSPISRPPWLRSKSSHLAPLYISRQLTRIATPLLYNNIHLPTQSHANKLLATLASKPHLAIHIHSLSIAGLWEDAARIMRLSANSLSELDLSITIGGDNDEHHSHTIDDAYAEALAAMSGIRHLTLRKPSNVYLSLTRPRAIINAVALAITNWPHLVRDSVII